MGAAARTSGPDFRDGVDRSELPEGGTIFGRVGEEPAILSRLDGRYFAIRGSCTHYGALLADGLIDGETVRCPWHHACFSLRTGVSLRAPAFDGLGQWRVDVEGDRLFVRARETDSRPTPARRGSEIGNVLIVGGGAAGFACADQLRRLGYEGGLTLVSADPDPPCDRPNLSKDYLAGSAPEEWIPLKDSDWYRQRSIDLRLGVEIVTVNTAERAALSRSGERLAYDRLLLATGADPVRLGGEVFGRPNVHVLRSLGDARAIIERAKGGARAIVVGSSFIGLEVAASLRAREVEVDVVSIDRLPFEKILGRRLGEFFLKLHRDNGVRFHLGREVVGYDGRTARLDDASSLPADFIVLGVGVRPRAELAATAGLETSNGICVDQYLETSVPGIFAAGDAAAYPDPVSGERIRVEHWVVAERQGQAVAANMLGLDQPFEATPFFWTEQYGCALRYVGRSTGWDEVKIDGDIGDAAFTARYFAKGRLCASASVGRDRQALDDEILLERGLCAARDGRKSSQLLAEEGGARGVC